MTRPPAHETIIVEGLTFELRRSERKTLGVTVDRDGSLRLSAPRGATREEVGAAARKKVFWVHRKLAERRALATAPQRKQFASGEGFCYLGRSYRLLMT
ncbi:MAG: M48 family metallopeptidase, partial [Actinomycetota bacterium]|nr:M48 family metallopeptidase [Actinomycetota bacterium]